MRIITPEIIHTLITEFSQGALVDYNPDTEIGCQRESFSDLGYGWVYFAIARAFDVRRALVVGSGRGFSVACIGLALDGKADSEVVLVDPGFTDWVVDEKVTDRACGLWQHGDDALCNFREKLGLNNIRLFPLRSDDAFEEFIKSRSYFDLIIIDGDHSQGQSLTDFKNALEILTPTGIIIVHDAYCSVWPGVATAIETLVLENPGLDRITIPNYPGIAIIQKRTSMLSFRIATVEENEIINSWREKEGLTVRPLSLSGIQSDEDDPQPGIHYENPNVGLFSVFENDELIGGFGLRYKTFMKEGPDDFLPDNGIPVSGYLCYGSVLHPDKRGRGRWMMINCIILRKLITEGCYVITRYTEHSQLAPYTVKRVGSHLPYVAFHYQLKIVERAKDNERLFREQQIANLNQVMVRYNEAIRTIEEIRASSSWRITAPMRYVSSKIKNIAGALKLLPSIIRFGGGVFGSARKAWRVFSREGWCGVKRRILFVGGNRSGIIGLKIRPDLTSAAVDRNDYTEWIRRYDTLSDSDLGKIRSIINGFQKKPLISIIMPVYNPQPEWLIEAIESVCNQLYQQWELCIADDASADKRIRLILESYAAKDKRIKVEFREKNGHISSASNSALAQTTGEWVALLDHDDLLAEHALFWVANTINQHPDADLIYSDEDKIDNSGRRFDPYFKCDWNQDLFYSHNLISHLGVYRAEILQEIGGFKEGMEGSQDYDLALRCIERIEAKQIFHIPRVLYHWRTHSKSTAKSGNVKPYALLAGEMALNEHFQRQGVTATAELLNFGMYRIHYTLPDKLPLVSLIILTRNRLQLLQKCMASILDKTTYPKYEILIVDNGSDDPATLQYLQELRSHPRIRVMCDDRPFNFSALNNAAVELARGEILGLLNNDLEVISAEWLSEMVSHALRSDIGAVGARLWYPDETLQHGGVILGLGGVAGHAHCRLPRYHYGYFGRAAIINSFSVISAACLIIRKAVFDEVGGLNEKDLPVAFNDVDFCLRLWEKGYRNVWTPYAELHHHESATRGYDNTPAKQKRFAQEVAYMKQRWRDILIKDPAYSPNLTLDYGDFSLAWPPRVNSIRDEIRTN